MRVPSWHHQLSGRCDKACAYCDRTTLDEIGLTLPIFLSPSATTWLEAPDGWRARFRPIREFRTINSVRPGFGSHAAPFMPGEQAGRCVHQFQRSEPL